MIVIGETGHKSVSGSKSVGTIVDELRFPYLRYSYEVLAMCVFCYVARVQLPLPAQRHLPIFLVSTVQYRYGCLSMIQVHYYVDMY